MANTASLWCSIGFLFLHICFHIIQVSCQGPLAPALYVFGDSTSDSGNNNFLLTLNKVNYTPYGIDFYLSAATGRFTNGKTCVDYIAQQLGLPLVPPYLGLSESDRRSITTGINYASGAAGMLPETGSAMGDVLSLDKQINYFRSTVTKDLPMIYKTPSALLEHLSNSIFFVDIGNNDYLNNYLEYLSNSIFFVDIGNNDYLNNYLQPAKYSSSKIYTPQQFADLLISVLKTRLTNLYTLGARKFVVFNIGRLGCVPSVVNAANATTPCVEYVNNLVLLYNNKFPSMIITLERALAGSTFVRGDPYGMNMTSAEIGIDAAQIPCCSQLSPITGLCIQGSTPCLDRSSVIFWDGFHTTQVVNNAMADTCFSGSSACVPINIQQLAQAEATSASF